MGVIGQRRLAISLEPFLGSPDHPTEIRDLLGLSVDVADRFNVTPYFDRGF
jgi:hypothetical protein